MVLVPWRPMKIRAEQLVNFLLSSMGDEVRVSRRISGADFDIERLTHVEDGTGSTLSWYRGNEPTPPGTLGAVVTNRDVPKELAYITIFHEKPVRVLRLIVERFFRADPGFEWGDHCEIHPSAQLLGEGQTYLREDHGWTVFPHCGGVRVGDRVHIGALTSIMRGSVGDTVIGDGAMIGSQVNIGHDTRIGKRVLVIAGARLAGWVRVEDDARINQGALIKNGVRIGRGAQIGMGAVVLEDVPANEVWVGNPARKLR